MCIYSEAQASTGRPLQASIFTVDIYSSDSFFLVLFKLVSVHLVLVLMPVHNY